MSTVGVRKALLALLPVLVGVGCKDPPAAPAAPATASAPRFHYFPFRIELDGDHAFRRVTFKDVGMGRKDPSPGDPLLEAIAESLSAELTQARAYGEASVAHDPALADPRSHLACEAHNLYVDVWCAGPKRWGYSLWSGCGPDDRFEWREVEIPGHPRDLTELVAPLARSIAESLRKAASRGCYRRSC
jgi:hypothetical protein